MFPETEIVDLDLRPRDAEDERLQPLLECKGFRGLRKATVGKLQRYVGRKCSVPHFRVQVSSGYGPVQSKTTLGQLAEGGVSAGAGEPLHLTISLIT